MGIYLGKECVSVVGGRASSTNITLQKKIATPSEKKQVVAADAGFNGLSSVTVDAVPSDYIGSSIQKKSAATYKPTTESQTISKNQFLSGDQVIEGDENLVSYNIRQGVSIFGVDGTMVESSSGEIDTSYVDRAISNHNTSSTAHTDIRTIIESANSKISELNVSLNSANAEIAALKALIEAGGESGGDITPVNPNPYSVSFASLDDLTTTGVWDSSNARLEF